MLAEYAKKSTFKMLRYKVHMKQYTTMPFKVLRCIT